MTSVFQDRLHVALLTFALLGLTAGLVLLAIGQAEQAALIWTAGVVG